MNKPNNSKSILIGLGVLVVFSSGFFAGEIARFIGIKRSEYTKGSYVKITGQCKTRDGGSITLTNDNVQITLDKKDELKGVLISEAVYISCPQVDITTESNSIRDFFVKDAIKTMTSKDTREIEKDPIYQYEKQSVLATAICTDSNGIKKIVNNKILDVLSIKEATSGKFELKTILLSKNEALRCTTEDGFKGSIVNPNDVPSFVEKEKLESRPKDPTTLKGKIIRITGICVKDSVKKKDLVDLLDRPARVVEEETIGGKVSRVWAKTIDEENKTISLICDKKQIPNLMFQETDLTELDLNKQTSVGEEKKPSQTKYVNVTGVCNEDGKEKSFYEQTLKVVDIVTDSNGAIFKVDGVLKINEKVSNVSCDKSNNRKLVIEPKLD